MYVRRIAYDQLSMKQWLAAMAATGAVIGLFLIGIGAYLLYQRYSHARHWQPVTATISGTGELCHMSRKSGKRYVFVEAVECQNAAGYMTAHPEHKWMSSRVAYVTFDYAVNGAPRKQLVQTFRISTEPVAAGQQLTIYVDPQNAESFDRPLAKRDYDDFKQALAMGLVTTAGMTIFGAFLGWLSERKRRRPAAE